MCLQEKAAGSAAGGRGSCRGHAVQVLQLGKNQTEAAGGGGGALFGPGKGKEATSPTLFSNLN